MKNKNYIQSVCSIRKNEIIVDGKTIIHTETSNFLDFAKIAYNDIGTNYPKFFKMDNLSKLAFIGAEILLKDVVDLSNNNIVLLFSNKSSSLDTDMRYQKSIAEKDNYYPSPSVFVYTLPNICLGEISIRHQLKSENSFLYLTRLIRHLW